MHDLSKAISYENYIKLFQIIPYAITSKVRKCHWPATCTNPSELQGKHLQGDIVPPLPPPPSVALGE